MSELKLFTAWQKLADGPARVQVTPTRQVEYSTAPPEKRDYRWSSHSSVAGGESAEIDVLEGETLSIRLASRIEVLTLVDLPGLDDPESPAAA